ncbi:MFS transporter [Saliphagus sp. GCM10025334]
MARVGAALSRSSLAGLAHYDALVLTALIWFLAKFLRYAFPPLFDAFQASYGVSNAVLGTAFTGFMLVYAAMQFPSGVLADRIGAVTVIVGGVVLASAGALVLVVDSPFVVLVGAMLVMGAGTGAHKTVAVRLLSRTYPERTGRALGFLDTLGTYAGVVAPTAVVLVAGLSLAIVGWRLLFLVAGAIGLVLGALFLVRVPKRLPGAARGVDSSSDESQSDASRPPSDPGLRRYASLFRDRRFTAFVLATICFSFTYNGLVAFAPLYLTNEAGLESATANLLYGALFAVSVVQLASGELSDRVGTLPVIVAALALATVATVVFVALTGTGSALALGVALVGIGLGSHGFRPVRGAYLVQTIPDSIAGGSLGVVRTLLMGAGAIAPAVVGILSETAGFRPAFWLLAGTVAVATLVCAGLLVTGSGEIFNR